MNNNDVNMNTMVKNVKPFLKWAGGKRWLVHRYEQLFPKHYQYYYEPFLGSGAVYFGLCPKYAHINDAIPELVETYCAIRDEWEVVWKYLLWHKNKHSVEHYYKVRRMIPKTRAARAARFIYLNRTCFNGIYRVNKNGLFNVPKGTKDSVIFEDDSFEILSKILKTAIITYGDFEDVVIKAKKEDFIYVDPPYTVKHNNNNFIKYNEKIFKWEDQIRLALALEYASRRGVLICISNANSKYVKELYPISRWHHIILRRQSIIASSSDKRHMTTELAITNYKVQEL